MKSSITSSVLVATLLGMSTAYFQRTVHSQSGSPTIELISVGTDGIAGNGPSGSGFLATGFPPRNRISADGRYVVFESEAFNLICSDTNSSQDIFLRDRQMGVTMLVSVAWNGAQANHNSFDPTISADGRYVAFESAATNLVPGDTNGFNDIFVRDLQAGTTTRVSVSSTGEQANSVSHVAAINANGRYIAFLTSGSNLVPNDTNNNVDIFVRDTQAGTTERVSVTTSGDQGSCCSSLDPSISADGRYVAFLSQNRLAPPINNNWQEIYVRDRQAGTTTLVSLTASGELSGGVSTASISADGRYVVFQSASQSIVTPDLNGSQHDIFLRDLVAGTTTLVSVASDGTQGNHDSLMPSISADGRYVTFHSWSNNLVPGDTNTGVAFDVFLRDTLLNTTTRLSVGMNGAEANGNSTFSLIGSDGSLTYFQSTASNLVSNERVNGFQDVFLYGSPYPGAGPPSFQFNSLSYSVMESEGSATITVSRTGNVCGTATVDYATSNGTATAGQDYAPESGTLTFLAGEGSKSFTVAIINDTADEPNETVNLTLSNPTGGLALGSPFAAVLTILDNDNSPPIAVNDSATTPAGNAITINVLANDIDADGDALTISSFTQGAHGAAVDNGNGTITYTPNTGFVGTDTFTYQASDGVANSNSATVTVVVTPVLGGPFEIVRAIIAGGGGSSSGAGYTLTGTIGQHDAAISSGGSYRLSGGFWPR